MAIEYTLAGHPDAAGGPTAAAGVGPTRSDAGALRSWRAGSIPAGGLAGALIVALLVVAALVGPLLVPADPARQDLAARLAPPLGLGGGAAHPLGTDALGRDLLARLIVGARVSLLVGLGATVAAGTVGVALGLLAGVARGPAERIVAWAVDVQQALPFVVVAIALGAALGPGLRVVLLTLALTGWVAYARVVRLQTLALRRAPWVEAARSLGAAPARIALRHLLPNLAAPILVLAGQQVAALILAEAALSYLGLGAGEGTITWGGMVAAGQESLFLAPWVSVVPGAAVALTVLGCNLVGDWLAGPRRPPPPPNRGGRTVVFPR